ncbi:MAG: orotate phosphoribosyltransferase-like protein [Candidatus Thermoplasmatota archaeon]
MKEIDTLIAKAIKYKESGLSDYEIGEELNISKDTATWLLARGKKEKPEGEVKIGWRSIGIYPNRIRSIADALTDIILEEIEKKNLQVDTIVGIAINGIPYALYIADALCLELAVFRPSHDKSGAFSSNYATVKDKNVVIIDDVVGSGETFKRAIKALKNEKATPVLCVAIINKKSHNDVQGVPLRALIRARAI